MQDTLFFYLSKIGWTLIKPDSWIVLGLIVGIWALAKSRTRLLRRIILFTATFSVVLTILPIGAWLLAPVEDAFPPRPAPDRVDGIIILGGFEDHQAQALFGQPATNAGAERLLAGLALARAHPDAPVVLSGGKGDARLRSGDRPNIGLTHALALGFDADRFVIEGASRNTYENAQNILAILDIPEEQNWVLVTSAHHMPRSVGIFCALGVSVVPYPVDYRSGARGRWPTWNFAGNLAALTLAARTWTGLVIYRVTGRSSELVPKLCQPA
ncbi:YdcF family protein [Shimia ponticola]|uniref:YdcF family protein n=1 Tax=Shimia ponticola TaxID=2582893 RepID=UPI0011BDE7DF|nr:YdcF family protein [Shimia ponticola]